jgi:hypothetical protein
MTRDQLHTEAMWEVLHRMDTLMDHAGQASTISVVDAVRVAVDRVCDELGIR